jgi:serine/threonine-protein kinase
MVAASGRSEALPARTALAMLATFAIGLGAVAWLSNSRLLIRAVPFEKPPVVLEDRARTLLSSLGYTGRPKDEASGFVYNGDFLRYTRAQRRGADRWSWLPSGRTPAVLFFHRSSPRHLTPISTVPRPTLGDPPHTVSGMTSIMLDPQGRLVQLTAVPAQIEAAATPGTAAPDWGTLFEAAGLDRSRFTEAAPAWTPSHYADVRAAWTGAVPELGDVPLRIEAAAYCGRPVYFAMVGPWTRPTRMQEAPETPLRRAAVVATTVMLAGILLTAVVVCRNNLRTGRGDRAGAARLALVVLALQTGHWLLAGHHIGDPTTEIGEFFKATADALLNAAIIWLAYVALEPAVRRRWPTSLVGWTRLLGGRWRDPLVGRDLLLGLASGAVFMLLMRMAMSAPSWFGLPPNTPAAGNADPLAGGLPVLLGVLALDDRRPRHPGRPGARGIRRITRRRAAAGAAVAGAVAQDRLAATSWRLSASTSCGARSTA